MEFDSFTCRLGDGQGRVVLPSGEVCFVLGELEAGRLADLVPGDHVEVVQVTDLTGVDLLRAFFSLRVPQNLPAALQWEVSLVVDKQKRASLRCAAGRARRITDLGTSVSKLSGPHEVGLRLELVVA